MKDDLRYAVTLLLVCLLMLGMYKLGHWDGQDDAAKVWAARLALALQECK